MVILGGDCTRIAMLERHSADVTSIEKIVSQNNASEVWVSACPSQAKGRMHVRTWSDITKRTGSPDAGFFVSKSDGR